MPGRWDLRLWGLGEGGLLGAGGSQVARAVGVGRLSAMGGADSGVAADNRARQPGLRRCGRAPLRGLGEAGLGRVWMRVRVWRSPQECKNVKM